MMIQVLELFIPITAKTYYANPDIMVALICCLWSVLCLSYFVSFYKSFQLKTKFLSFKIPLTNLVKHRAILYSTLITIFVVSIILSFTSVGFPYSDNKANPRLQRFRVMHTKRTFYDHEGSVKTSSNDYLLFPYDRNSFRTIESSFGAENLFSVQDDEMCSTEIHCGFPRYFERGRYLKGFKIEPTVKPTEFSILKASRNPNNPSQFVVEFSLKLSTLTSVHIAPGNGWKFINGTLQSTEQLWKGRKFQTSIITYGRNTGEIYIESFTLEVRWSFLYPDQFLNSDL